MSGFTARYLRRKNLGNYEHEELELSVACEEQADVDATVELLKSKVNRALGLVPTNTLEPKAEKVEEKPKTEKVTKKTTKKKTTKKVEKVEVDSIPTLDEVRTKLKEVYMAKGKEAAEAIVKAQGVTKSSELSEDSYKEVLASCDKALEA